MPQIQKILITDIKAGKYEQRLSLDDEDITALAESIKSNGLIYPIIVAADGDKYILVDGHRRLAAHMRLGRDRVESIVMRTDAAKSSEISLAGNFFHKKLTPVELSCAMNDCLKSGALTVEEMCIGFHRSKNWVLGMMAIAEWPEEIQVAIHKEQISVSAASNLVCVTDETYRTFLVRNAVESGATARTTAAWLQAWRAYQPAEDAIQAQPVPGEPRSIPATPQGPCFCCGQVFPITEMSHVPACGGCVKIIRAVGSVQA